MKKIGLYIHIPFCRSKCPYCDFYSMRSDSLGYDDYTACVLESLEDWNEKIGRKADTLYLGGGTPSLIGGKNVAMIVRRAKELFDVDGEITVECNPSAIDDDFFETVAKAWVNRISLGMQSAVDSERKKLGRSADRARITDCITNARKAGIENITLDIMLGVPGQTMESLKESVDFCLESGVPHISAYMLKLEEGTYYYYNAEKLNLPDEDTTADMYLFLSEKLTENGFEHYEISNFAKPGYEGKHNLKYWNGEEYLGIGPSAHSFIDGDRFFYPRDIKSFSIGEEPIADGTGGDEEEYIMLRLRLKQGLVFKEYYEKYHKNLSDEVIEKAKLFEKQGLVTVNDTSIALTREGFLLSNTIISELIYV
ncbi:MAG: radical SAM family heme chaperone HemW [Clostridia bacterium]|nr:radical SAM family heme chaperone HemW [Clostridia bacterium]